MGTVAIANRRYGVLDNKKVVEADVTLSAGYDAGGDTIPLGQVGLRRVDEMLVPSHDLISHKPITSAAVRGGRTMELTGTSTAPKIKSYDTFGVETAAGTNLTPVTLRVRFVGV
jgi:hypothetical protein